MLAFNKVDAYSIRVLEPHRDLCVANNMVCIELDGW